MEEPGTSNPRRPEAGSLWGPGGFSENPWVDID